MSLREEINQTLLNITGNNSNIQEFKYWYSTDDLSASAPQGGRHFWILKLKNEEKWKGFLNNT